MAYKGMTAQEYQLQWTRKKRATDPEWRARRQAICVKWRRNHPKQYLIASAKHRCARSGIPFSLEENDIEIPKMCPVLGIPIFNTKGRNNPNSPSIDRLVPEKGYIQGNVRVISLRANRLRSDASAAELMRVAVYAAGVESNA